MRALIWLTVLLAGLYGGYWFVGSRAVLKGAETALIQLKADGRADYSNVELAGFPSRFDVTISDPKLVSADGLESWTAPFLQLFALSYRPNHIIAVWPHDQTVTFGAQTFDIKSSDMRASVAFTAGLSLPLEHSELEGHDLALSSNFGWSVLAEKLIFATRQSSLAPYSHEVAIVVTGLVPGDDLRRMVDPKGLQPKRVDEIRISAVPVFDRPIDRSAAVTPPQITGVRNIAAALAWGSMSLDAKGDLGRDDNGFAKGRIGISAHSWREIYAMFVDAGLVRKEIAPTIENVLTELAKSSGEDNLMVLPLIFDGGRARLGPIPLGPAPRF